MFCRKCGKEIDDEAVVCIHCGCAVEEQKKNSDDDRSRTGLGILLGWLLGLIGLIIGLCIFKPDTIARKTFLKAWGITFAICFVLNIIVGVIYGSLLAEMFDEIYGALFLMVG